MSVLYQLSIQTYDRTSESRPRRTGVRRRAAVIGQTVGVTALATVDLGSSAAIILAAVGLGTTAALIFVLAREDKRIGRGDLYMFLVLFVLYALQLANAVQLQREPHRVGLIANQGVLAVLFFLFGIARSWQLVGAREFGLMATMASMIHRAADNGPHSAGADQEPNVRPGPNPEDSGTGHASA